MRDALIEIWHADADGHYAHPADAKPSSFRGWGRTGADFNTGVWRFETIKPGAVPARTGGGKQAPHTRMYFDDEAAANASDPVLNSIEWEVRRKTLIGVRELRGSEVVYRFDIRLQGGEGLKETVFFDV